MKLGPVDVEVPVLAATLLLACAVGCKKNDAQANDAAAGDADGGMAGAEAPGIDPNLMAGAAAPPPAIVSADPNIPLNEAVVGAAPTSPDFSADAAPPAPALEDPPARPDPADVWTPGYWWWSPPLVRYVWVSGAWRRPPPGQVWSPGSWNPVGRHFFWTPGYWGPQGYARVYVDAPPPPLQAEAYVAPPSVGFVWTPGYYDYRGDAYAWVGGSWLRPPAVGLGWIEPRYVPLGARFTFQPGRWDFAPELRGVVYRPDIDVRAGAHLRLVPMPLEVVVAHARFCHAAAYAMARGGTRMPNGGFVLHGPWAHDHDRDFDHDRDPGHDRDFLHEREHDHDRDLVRDRERDRDFRRDQDHDHREFPEPRGGPAFEDRHGAPANAHGAPPPHADPGGEHRGGGGPPSHGRR